MRQKSGVRGTLAEDQSFCELVTRGACVEKIEGGEGQQKPGVCVQLLRTSQVRTTIAKRGACMARASSYEIGVTYLLDEEYQEKGISN